MQHEIGVQHRPAKPSQHQETALDAQVMIDKTHCQVTQLYWNPVVSSAIIDIVAHAAGCNLWLQLCFAFLFKLFILSFLRALVKS